MMGPFEGADLPTLYIKKGYAAEILFWASITATIQGQTITGDVCVPCLSIVNEQNYSIVDCTEFGILTTERLNSYLNTVDGAVSVYLANADYHGTVIIPKDKKVNLFGEKNTRLIGNINLSDTASPGIKIDNICFIAPENSNINAIYNGDSSVSNCVFYNYVVGIELSAQGLINFNSCVFIDNEIAVLVDIAHQTGRGLPTQRYNTFINNGIAVQVLSLNERTSPYYFRIVDSNFIHNDIDFDAQCGGTIYLYHNYFWRAPKPETPAAKLPEANKEYYACVYESIIKAGSNYHMGADDLHWFQAGPEGAVIIEFGTYSNDDKDYYTNYHAAPLENKEFKVLP